MTMSATGRAGIGLVSDCRPWTTSPTADPNNVAQGERGPQPPPGKPDAPEAICNCNRTMIGCGSQAWGEKPVIRLTEIVARARVLSAAR